MTALKGQSLEFRVLHVGPTRCLCVMKNPSLSGRLAPALCDSLGGPHRWGSVLLGLREETGVCTLGLMEEAGVCAPGSEGGGLGSVLLALREEAGDLNLSPVKV